MSTNTPSDPASDDSTQDKTRKLGSAADFDRIAAADEFDSGIDYGSAVEDDDTAADPKPKDKTEKTPVHEERSTQEGSWSATAPLASSDASSDDKPASATGAATLPIRTSTGSSAASATDAKTTPLSSVSDKDDASATKVEKVPGASSDNMKPTRSAVEEHRRVLREAQGRLDAREEAVLGSRKAAKTLQVLLAIFAPITLLILVIRAVASPVFLWIEYHRPWFPADEFGFSTGERMRYGSYGMDYLFNFAPPSYLGSLTFPDGSPVFTTGEVDHMADVKGVMMATMFAGLILLIACIVFMVFLTNMSKGAIRRSLFAGSIWFLSLMILLGVLGVLFWEEFFATFHALFFDAGTWTFYTSDTLIRLYPNQFWVDAGIAVSVLSLIVAIITLVFTWPTRRRRERSSAAQLTLLASKSAWRDKVKDSSREINLK